MNNKRPVMDVDYFLRKFRSIPATRWQRNMLGSGKVHCALGHCGMRSYDKRTAEASALVKVLSMGRNRSRLDVVFRLNDLGYINDIWGYTHYVSGAFRMNPKRNMIEGLKFVKKMTKSTKKPSKKVLV